MFATLYILFVTVTTIGSRSYLYVYQNIALTSFGSAFSNLTTIGGYLDIRANGALTTLGSAFSSLATVGGHLTIYSDHPLTSLGTAFSNLTEVHGYIHIRANPRLSNFETLRNLRCHGGVYTNDPSNYCQNCPSRLINLPLW